MAPAADLFRVIIEVLDGFLLLRRGGLFEVGPGVAQGGIEVDHQLVPFGYAVREERNLDAARLR